MGLLFIILLVVLIELIQILNSRFKIIKWIFPILSFLFSINMLLGMITFDKHDVSNNEVGIITLTYNILYLVIFNIPTIIFIVTNFIINRKQITDKKIFKNIKISILLTLVFVIVLFIFMQISASKSITKVNIEDRKNVIGSNLTTF